MKIYSPVVIIFLSIVSCSSSTKVTEENPLKDFSKLLYDVPDDLRDPNINSKVISEYSTYLNGKTFILDPGHGGNDRRNVSPNDKVIEADVNLKVALHLRSMLTKAGAIVLMTRDSDTTVSLEERSEFANKSSADFFISIHHNSTADSSRNWVNYTSTFYHSIPGDYSYDPFEQELARYIQCDLSFVLGNPGGLGSFDGTYSDFMIQPQLGFHVLREVEIPAVLVECAFFTHALEEERLQIDQFNKIEAWGIFKGIGKFLEDGFPKLILDQQKSTVDSNFINLVLRFTENMKIDYESVKVFADGVPKKFETGNGEDEITITFRKQQRDEIILKVIAADKNGKFAAPFVRQIMVN